VDCRGFALSYSSDVAITGAWTPPAAASAAPAAPTPAAPAPAVPAATTPAAPTATEPAKPSSSSPGQGQGGGAANDGKGAGKGSGKGKQGLLELIPSAHAAAADYNRTNRILYEFGETMRRRGYVSDNAACLFTTEACAVTIRY
jgi:hypothetical protein